VSRFNHFIRGLGSSWLATFATVIYSLLSVPICLRYLSPEEFGLFVLLLQVAGYFFLIEFGMSVAASRILVDYKDDAHNGNYGSAIITTFLIFGAQAVILVIVGMLAAPFIVTAVGIPDHLAEVGTFLLRWLVATSAAATAFRVYNSILFANKRLDLVHAITGSSILCSLVLLATILAFGGGLKDLIWLFLTQAVFTILLPTLACYKLALMPERGCWGRPSIQRFNELFGYGKDVFLVNVGNQVLEASQLIVVTRTMGLTAAAAWSVSTKLFTLVYQLITKVEGTAIVFFAEMMVRGEKEKLAARFRQIYQLTAGMAVAALVMVASVNRPFISVWAEPILSWPLLLSLLFATFILLNLLIRCGANFIAHTKDIAALRYIYFGEAIVFIFLAFWLGPILGFYGVAFSSIVSLLLFRAPYITWRLAHYFQLSTMTFWWTWLKRPILAGIILLPFVISSAWMADSVTNSWGQLFIAAAWVGLPAAIVLLFVALPRDVKREFAQRLPQFSSIAKY
jgi:O-antigen/teichoic acid export membrane protein